MFILSLKYIKRKSQGVSYVNYYAEVW